MTAKGHAQVDSHRFSAWVEFNLARWGVGVTVHWDPEGGGGVAMVALVGPFAAGVGAWR